MAKAKPLSKCRRHGKKRDRFGNCWNCLSERLKAAEVALCDTLAGRQFRLFGLYKKASAKRTSAMIKD